MVCKSNIIFPCVHPSVCLSSVHLPVTQSPPKPQGGIQLNFYITSSHGKGVREYMLFFSVTVNPCVRRPSISVALSPPKPLGGIQPNFPSWQGCARATLFFRAFDHLSVRLSPPKSLGGIQPNWLHHFPFW